MSIDDFIVPTISKLNLPITKAFENSASLAEATSCEIESAIKYHLHQKDPTFFAVEKYNVQIIKWYSRGYSLTHAQSALVHMLSSYDSELASLARANQKSIKALRELFDRALLQTAVFDAYKEHPQFVFIDAMRDATNFGEEALFRKITKEERDEIIAYRNAVFTQDMPNIDAFRYTAIRLKSDVEFQNKCFVSTFCDNFNELTGMLKMRSEFCPDDFLKTSALLDTLDTIQNMYYSCSGIDRKGKNVKEEDDDDSSVY